MMTTSSQRSNFQPAARIVPTVREAERAMHADRAGVGRVADHRQHLARAGRLAARDQFDQEQPAEAAALRARGEIDRILDAEAIRRAAAGTGSRRRSRERAVVLEDQTGQALGDDVVAPARHLGAVGRLDLERSRAVAHMPAVDRGDGARSSACSGGSAIWLMGAGFAASL